MQGQDTTLAMSDGMKPWHAINSCKKRLGRTTAMTKRSENEDALQEADISARAYHVATDSRIDCRPEAASRADQSPAVNNDSARKRTTHH